jgi:hypothetical protein
MSSCFWRMDHPEDASVSTAWDVDLRHPYGLPGVYCPVCRQTWGGSRVLLVPCPPPFHKHPNVRGGGPIPLEEHLALREQIRAALARSGGTVPPLMPGDQFQPGQLKLRSEPHCDFLWPWVSGPVVSPQVKELFEQQQVSGVEFAPVEVTRPHRRSGPPFYQMVIGAESGRPPGAEITHVCSGCGRQEDDDAKREFVLTQRMIPAADVFYPGTTLWMIVNQKVRDLILDHHLTNVHLGAIDTRAE